MKNQLVISSLSDMLQETLFLLTRYIYLLVRDQKKVPDFNLKLSTNRSNKVTKLLAERLESTKFQFDLLGETLRKGTKLRLSFIVRISKIS